jgi:hypothetical protein
MSCIITHSGKRFDFDNPSIASVDLYDIAWAVSHINRFTGHTDPPISDAVHMLLCAQKASPLAKLWALTHDAHEAYVGDVSSPLKEYLPDYCALERRIQHVVVMAILGGWPSQAIQDEVHEIDQRMGRTEAHTALKDASWARNPYPGGLGLYPYIPPVVARRMWLEAYWRYGGPVDQSPLDRLGNW